MRIRITWWVHADDPAWFNEVSFWESKEAIDAWHNTGYHKFAKKWAAESGAIIEDVITNFSLETTRVLRICPCCHQLQDFKYDLGQEQKTLAEPCPQCGFHFPVMKETPDSFAVFKDIH